MQCTDCQIKQDNAAMFELSTDQVQELHQEMWTTCDNLNEWFDIWEIVCFAHGFTELTPADGKNFINISFSEEQKCRIVNMD